MPGQLIINEKWWWKCERKKNDQNAICANYYSLRLTREKKKMWFIHTRIHRHNTYWQPKRHTKIISKRNRTKCLRKMRLTSLWMEAYSNTFTTKCITKEKRAGMEQKELNYQMRRTSQWINRNVQCAALPHTGGNENVYWFWCMICFICVFLFACTDAYLQYRWFGFGKWTVSSEYLSEMHHPLNLFISSWITFKFEKT